LQQNSIFVENKRGKEREFENRGCYRLSQRLGFFFKQLSS